MHIDHAHIRLLVTSVRDLLHRQRATDSPCFRQMLQQSSRMETKETFCASVNSRHITHDLTRYRVALKNVSCTDKRLYRLCHES